MTITMSNPKQILMIDANTRNLDLLAEFLSKQGFRSIRTTSVEEFNKLIITNTDGIGLAMIDISGFSRDIWLACEQLTERNIPFIVVSPKQVATIREEGRVHGAREVLTKPLVAKDLLSLIRSVMGER